MKHCDEHEAAKRSFNEVSQLFNKLVNDNEDYVIDYFEQAEASILMEKETNQQKTDTYYQKLVDDAHESKIKCLANLKTNWQLESDLNEIKETLIGHENKLKRESLAFLLKTLDGNDAKWRKIQIECDSLLKNIRRQLRDGESTC